MKMTKISRPDSSVQDSSWCGFVFPVDGVEAGHAQVDLRRQHDQHVGAEDRDHERPQHQVAAHGQQGLHQGVHDTDADECAGGLGHEGHAGGNIANN